MLEDENTTPDVQDETSTTPDLQDATSTTSDSDATSETTTSTDKDKVSAEDLQAQIKRLESALKKANNEGKTHRLKSDKLEKVNAELAKFKEDAEAKDLSEKEKQALVIQKKEQELAEKLSELEKANTRIRDLAINQAVLTQAGKLNIVDPDAAILFIKSDIELDDSGDPTNVEELLKNLIKDKPYLVAQSKPTSTSGGPTNPSRSQTSGAQPVDALVTKLAQGQLSSEEYNALPIHVRMELQKKLGETNTKRR